jgi:hypothetical protein
MFADGRYSFRFGGYAMSRAIPHHVTGVGWMQLSAGTIKGEHVSAITRLSGSDAAFENNRYKLEGTLVEKDNFGLAQIRFSEDDSVMERQILDAAFHLVPAGADRFWLVSTSTRIVSAGNAPADELVSGEAVRIGD